MTIEAIQALCAKNALRWTNHILARLFARGIKIDDVLSVLANGEIIEQYPADYPYPSCLVLGLTGARRNLHVVCGMSEAELWLITLSESRRMVGGFQDTKGVRHGLFFL